MSIQGRLACGGAAALVAATMLTIATSWPARGQSAATAASGPASAPATQPKWKNGPSTDPSFFPLAVWLQDPKNAAKFQAIGINTYVGLWEGPTEPQLAELKKQGMKVICDQNSVGLAHRDDPTIIAWMHGDEPDNAQDIKHWKSPEQIVEAWPDAPKQPLAKWGAYGPPIPPKTIIADYEKIKKNDPTRPVMLNLGQGVAYDDYIGRGYRRGKLGDYHEYIKGCDIVSFDIYPMVEDAKEVAGKLEYVPRGVERLVKWSEGKKPVWNCIECTHISNPPAIASPEQIRSEVWMSIIAGSRGIIYFVHEFKPKFIEAGLLAHEEQKKAVAEINKRITSLAPVINGPNANDLVKVELADPKARVAIMVKQQYASLYIFSANLSDKATKAKFTLASRQHDEIIMDNEVLGENRKVELSDFTFIEDSFKPYEVHIYKLLVQGPDR